MSAKKIMKACTACGEVKHQITGFTEVRGARPAKFYDECRVCRSKAKAAAKEEERKKEHARMELVRRRRCPCCGELKSLTDFSADQLRYAVGKCKTCKPYKTKQAAPERVSTIPWPWKYNGKVYEEGRV